MMGHTTKSISDKHGVRRASTSRDGPCMGPKSKQDEKPGCAGGAGWEEGWPQCRVPGLKGGKESHHLWRRGAPDTVSRREDRCVRGPAQVLKPRWGKECAHEEGRGD